MAKKVFLSSERAIPSPQIHSVSREEIASTSKNNSLSEQLPFMILDETSKSFPKFNATGRSLLIMFNSPAEEQNPVTYLKECITALTDYLVDDMPGRDLVGLRIRSTENVEDKVVGISLRRRDQLKPDVIWAVHGKAKNYICNGSNTLYNFTHKCDKVCSLCTTTPPCTKDQATYCSTRNRRFLSEKCFQNHLTLKVKCKLVCQWGLG